MERLARCRARNSPLPPQTHPSPHSGYLHGQPHHRGPLPPWSRGLRSAITRRPYPRGRCGCWCGSRGPRHYRVELPPGKWVV